MNSDGKSSRSGVVGAILEGEETAEEKHGTGDDLSDGDLDGKGDTFGMLITGGAVIFSRISSTVMSLLLSVMSFLLSLPFSCAFSFGSFRMMTDLIPFGLTLSLTLGHLLRLLVFTSPARHSLG